MTGITRILGIATAVTLMFAPPSGAEEKGFENSRSYAGKEAGVGPDWLPQGGWQMPAGSKKEVPSNTVVPKVISAEAKMNAMQSMMLGNPLSLRDMMSMMVAKKKVDDGLTLEEVVESMDLRANLLNMKKVGHSTPWKVIEATTGEPSPKLEMLSYCDIPTMRLILDYVPEFSVFVPCRISVVEDASGDLWIMTLDWDVRWLDTSPNPNKISPELREAAILVRENLESIMEAGANGDL